MLKLARSLSCIVLGPRQYIKQKVKLPIYKFLYDTVDVYKTRTKSGVNNIRDILFRGTIVALITALLVWLAIFMYVAFYYAYVPSVSHERPVHLKFRSCPNWDIHKSVCSFPSASVELSHNQQLLMTGQIYRIFLDLEMPESPTNKELGMFMVCADFLTKNGQVVSNSCRSAMLQYKSTIINVLEKFVFSPFFVLGGADEKQNVRVELFSAYQEPENEPVTNVNIEIQTRHIEIYSASFKINANFAGLRYVMFYWPLLSAAIGITSNLFFIALVCVMSWYQIINSDEYLLFMKQNEKQHFSDDDESDEVSLVGDETDLRNKGTDC